MAGDVVLNRGEGVDESLEVAHFFRLIGGVEEPVEFGHSEFIHDPVSE